MSINSSGPGVSVAIMCTLINITALQTQLLSGDTEGYITTVNSTTFTSDLPHISIQIPPELIQLFANSSGGDGGEVRVISALFYNVEDLFPSGRPGSNKYVLQVLVFTSS